MTAETVTATHEVAELDLLDPGFRIDSPEVRAAAERHWYATTSLGPAVLRYEDCAARGSALSTMRRERGRPHRADAVFARPKGLIRTVVGRS